MSRGWIRIFTFGCPEVGLEELENRIPKPTSGHQQVTRSRRPEVGLGILDLLPIPNPTSGHRQRPTEISDPQKCRRRNEDATRTRNTQKACKFIGFPLVLSTRRHSRRLQHIPRSTGQGLEALSINSPKKINVFLAEK